MLCEDDPWQKLCSTPGVSPPPPLSLPSQVKKKGLMTGVTKARGRVLSSGFVGRPDHLHRITLVSWRRIALVEEGKGTPVLFNYASKPRTRDNEKSELTPTRTSRVLFSKFSPPTSARRGTSKTISSSTSLKTRWLLRFPLQINYGLRGESENNWWLKSRIARHSA